MKKLNIKDVALYVEQHIGTFHQKRIQSLDDLKLTEVLRGKNPYLFKAKYVLTAEQIGYKAKEKNDDFIQSYSQMINKFTKDFANTFCTDTGTIDWKKLVGFNSSINRVKIQKGKFIFLP